MANSTTNLDTISSTQAYQEVTANELFDAGSPGTLYGRRASTCSGLTWGYYGGYVLIGGTATAISNGTVALTASSTNYVEADPATGAVSKNTTGFTAGSIPLYAVVTGTATVSSYTDYRMPQIADQSPRLAKSMASDANITLTQAEARATILNITSAVSLGATRDVVLPLKPKFWMVYNGTTGGQSLQFIGATGTGITVANAKAAIVAADGTNVIRITADA